MRTIHKYPLHVGTFSIQLPLSAKPLAVQCQDGRPVLWCEVSTDNKVVSRPVCVFGTGHEIPQNFQGTYVGTFQIDSTAGILVFHVYLGPEPSQTRDNRYDMPLRPVVPNPGENRLDAAIRNYGAKSMEAEQERKLLLDASEGYPYG